MALRAANTSGSSIGGFLWFLVLTASRVSGQECQTETAPVTGTAFGGDNTFDCAEGAYASEVHVSFDTVGFVGFILWCSDGESKVFGICFDCDDSYHNVDCTGGLTEMSLTPSLDEDDVYPANANFFCYNEDNPSGTSLGPYPPEGGNPDTSAEITWSSCADGTYAAGISAFERLFIIFGVALRCRTIDEASCPAPDGLLVPGTTGTADDDTNDPATSIPTPGPMSESPTEPTPENTPTPVSIPTPEPTSEPTADPIPEPTPTPVLVQTSQPTSEPTTEPSPESTLTPVSVPTPEPTDITSIGQPRPPTSSPLPIATPSTYTDDETSATTPTLVGPTMTPSSSPSPIATSATETEDDASATTQNPVGPTLFSTSPVVPLEADDDNDDGSDDEGIWTETVTAVVSSVASAIALAFLAFVFKRVRGSRDGGCDDGDDHGNNRNGGTVIFNYFSEAAPRSATPPPTARSYKGTVTTSEETRDSSGHR